MSPSRLRRSHTDGSGSSMESHSSYASNYTRSTVPTNYEGPSQPSLRRHESGPAHFSDWTFQTSPSGSIYDPRDSTSTYASTIPSDEDLPEDDIPYEVPEEDDTHLCRQAPSTSHVFPSTPPEFADLFPSTRRLLVRHDDTIDGNMNLRVDTPVSAANKRVNDITLFHLRMHDLKSRQFSLRRYCRESGREVCHTRKVAKAQAQARPTLQRSVGSMLSNLRGHRSEIKEAGADSGNLGGIRRHDSGYDSLDDEAKPEVATVSSSNTRVQEGEATNVTKLEFTNYAQVDVRRLGSSATKRYEFEYWGTNYIWRRAVKKADGQRSTSYHLINSHTGKSVAHILPETLSSSQAAEEQFKGGWIPQCSMWIGDPTILSGLTDVADVIIATGLIALVDDSIARRFHTKKSVNITVPVPLKSSLKLNMEYVGPKRLLDEVFSRRSSGHARHPTPLRQISAGA